MTEDRDRAQIIAGIAQVASLVYPPAGGIAAALAFIVPQLMKTADESGKPGPEKRADVLDRVDRMAAAAGAPHGSPDAPADAATIEQIEVEADRIIEDTIRRRKVAQALSHDVRSAILKAEADGVEDVPYSGRMSREMAGLVAEMLAEWEGG